MTVRLVQNVAVALTLALAGCSRDSNQSPGSPAAPKMEPASGRDTAGARPGCAENFAAFDDDGDGRVSENEFSSHPHAQADAAGVFRARDRNGDGTLEVGEFCAGWRGSPRSGARPGADAGAYGMRGGMRRGMGRPMSGMHCDEHFDAFDADHDGKLTREEFSAWPHHRGDADTLFDERDVNRDGTIARGEFCAAWK